MKKVIFFVLFFCSCLVNVQGQVEYKEIDKLTFLGVDFTQVKVFGASEYPTEFQQAFLGINHLFQSEPKKYNLQKYFKKKEVYLAMGPTFSRIEDMDLKELYTEDRSTLTKEEVHNYVLSLPTDGVDGYAAIIIADLLDKGKKRATYHIIVYNPDTKDIALSKEVVTKPGGFGLRNYWAGSVLQALKVAVKK